MKLLGHEIRDLSTDRNDFFLRSAYHVAAGLLLVALVAWGVWELTDIVAALPKGH